MPLPPRPPPRGVLADGRLHLPPRPGHRPGPADDRRRSPGAIRQVRASYLQDWIVDPQVPLAWRLQKDQAGSGSLGDIGAHIIDLAQFLLGDRIITASGTLETFVKTRPDPGRRYRPRRRQAGESFGEVTVDDASLVPRAASPAGAVGLASKPPGSPSDARTR